MDIGFSITKNEAQEKNDRQWQSCELSGPQRFIVRVLSPLFNKLVATATGRAFERGMIDSKALHNIMGISNRMLFPKRGLSVLQDDIARINKDMAQLEKSADPTRPRRDQDDIAPGKRRDSWG